MTLLNFLIVLAQAAIVSTPAKCLEVKNIKCSIWNKNLTGYELKNKNASVLLQPEAIVSFEGERVDLISGNAIVFSDKATEISTSFASFICESCHVQLQIEKGKLVVQHIEGSLQFKTIDQNEYSVFPVGYQTKFYPVDALTGKAKVEVFRVADFADFLNFFNSFENAESYKTKWEGRKAFFIEKAKEAAEVYQQEAERQVASEMAIRQKRDAKLEEERKERAKYRRMFREKNYLE